MSQDKQPHSTHQADSIMLTLVLILAVLGLLILFSASEYNGRVRFHDSAYYFKKQLFATALGLGAMYLVSSIDFQKALLLQQSFGAYSLFCFCFFQNGCAVRTAGGFDADLTLAVWTDLCLWFCRSFFFLCQACQLIDSFHKTEKNKSHDDKVYNC